MGESVTEFQADRDGFPDVRTYKISVEKEALFSDPAPGDIRCIC
jgi:hypothetical protein